MKSEEWAPIVKEAINSMKKLFPFLEWIKTYKRSDLLGDLFAGITVGVMFIPQGMAYALVAGLPPAYGLYAATIPLLVYALLGSSRQLSVGPTAMVSLLVLSGIAPFAELGSEQFISYAILLALIVGSIQLAMGIFRLGFIVNFLSHPVVAGFSSAAAIIIGFSQLKYLLGIDIPRGKVHDIFLYALQNYQDIHLITVVIGMVCIALLFGLKHLHPRIPAPLIVVLLGIGGAFYFGLEERGVHLVGEVPAGLPSFAFPDIEWKAVQKLFPAAVAIALIGLMESIAVSKAIQAKHKSYKLRPSQEMIGIGLANIMGSFFKAFPISGAFSRTAVNDQAGAKTHLSSIISAGLVALTLLYLIEYFYYLPQAILAAIIIVAVIGLVDVKEGKHLWETNKVDFAIFMLTALTTLFWGIQEGILMGVIVSLAVVLYRISYPHVTEIAYDPRRKTYDSMESFSDLEQHEGILIMRFDAKLYYANADFFHDNLMSLLENREGIRHVLLDMRGINVVDSTAMHMLHDLIIELRVQGMNFYLVQLKETVKESLRKGKIMELLGEEYLKRSITQAVEDICTISKKTERKK